MALRVSLQSILNSSRLSKQLVSTLLLSSFLGFSIGQKPGMADVRSHFSHAAASRDVVQGQSIAQGRGFPRSRHTRSNTIRLPNQVEWEVYRYIFREAGTSRLRITGFSPEQWPDTCLGIPDPAESCASAQTDGWRVTVTSGQTDWIVRTNADATDIRLEPQAQAQTPPNEIRDRTPPNNQIENQTNPILLPTPVEQSQTPLIIDPPSHESYASYCDSSTLRIMPLGDSITHGSAIQGGYRIELWQRFLETNQSIDFVGSESNGPLTIDRDHEGHPGKAIQYIQGEINSWLNASSPQIILLMIGTNDMLYPGVYDSSSAPQRLSELIQNITQSSPETELFVASVPRLNDPIANNRVRDFNSQLPEIVNIYAREGKRVHYVDIYSVLTPSDLADGVHPNTIGYDKIADTWYGAISELIEQQCQVSVP